MNDEPKEKKDVIPILLTVSIGVIVFMIPAFFLHDYMDMQWEIDYLKDELDTRVNVSDDYRSGWLDCIDSLHDLRWKVDNITSQMDIVVGDRQMKGTVILPRKTPCAILLSGHKKYYNFDNTFNNLQKIGRAHV